MLLKQISISFLKGFQEDPVKPEAYITNEKI